MTKVVIFQQNDGYGLYHEDKFIKQKIIPIRYLMLDIKQDTLHRLYNMFNSNKNMFVDEMEYQLDTDPFTIYNN